MTDHSVPAATGGRHAAADTAPSPADPASGTGGGGYGPADLPPHPFRALWALCIGFFMILVDSTIVSVATPSILTGLNANIDEVVWVTSAYLLAYAVPLLFTGRLGDRFGPKAVYQVGLVVFTLSSAWCGLSDQHHDAHPRPGVPGARAPR